MVATWTQSARLPSTGIKLTPRWRPARMSTIWVCSNPEHPTAKHPRNYTEITQDGFCPDCPFGEGVLAEQAREHGSTFSSPPVNDIGLCILVCDASFSMHSAAFPPSELPTKI